MKLSFSKAAVVVATLALAACSTITSVPVGDYKVSPTYTVTVGRQWADVTRTVFNRSKKVKILSVDGPLLNRLYLVEGLAPGEFIVKPLAKEQPTPTYREGMSPTELVEFVADSASALDYQRVETSGLRPAKFGSEDALRFDLTALTKEGLETNGSAVVAEKGGKLYVMLYLAPKEHYYGVLLPEVETVFGSARVG